MRNIMEKTKNLNVSFDFIIYKYIKLYSTMSIQCKYLNYCLKKFLIYMVWFCEKNQSSWLIHGIINWEIWQKKVQNQPKAALQCLTFKIKKQNKSYYKQDFRHLN